MATFTTELDNLDDATASTIVQTYLDDLAAIERDGVNTGADESAARDINILELLHYCAVSNFNIPEISVKCVSCEELKPLSTTHRNACNHRYCQECLRDLFSRAMTDEFLYPPRCCGRVAIPLQQVRTLLGNELARDFEHKQEELDDVNRIYCHVPACSTYIGHQNRDADVATATCPQCNERTCLTCKNTTHQGDCPEDEGLQRTLETAREQGYQRCQACRRMIELTVGCYHITCLCGAEFCYLCGLPWKTCDCERFDDHHLLADEGPEDAQEAGDDFEDLMRYLREDDHRCNHETWVREPGRHICIACGDELPHFIMRCTRCRAMLCRRCQMDRV